jgi:hypothetical protein
MKRPSFDTQQLLLAGAIFCLSVAIVLVAFFGATRTCT